MLTIGSTDKRIFDGRPLVAVILLFQAALAYIFSLSPCLSFSTKSFGPPFRTPNPIWYVAAK